MTTPSAEQLNEYMVGFDRLYGLELVDFSDGEVRARVQLRDELKQPMGLLHGGVYASIAESLASLATRCGGARQRRGRDGPVEQHQLSAAGHRGDRACARRAAAQRSHDLGMGCAFSDDAGRTCAVTRMTIAVRPAPAA